MSLETEGISGAEHVSERAEDAGRSIGSLIAHAREGQGKSQARLADVLCKLAGNATLTRHEISRWENGTRVPKTYWLQWLAEALDIPIEVLERACVVARRNRAKVSQASTSSHGALIGHAQDSQLSKGVGLANELVAFADTQQQDTIEGVDRQSFLRLAGVGMLAGPALIELATATQPSQTPDRIGHREIEEIRTVTRVFKNWDALYGGGLAREAVVSQLRYTARLLNARYPDAFRGELYSAVGRLGGLAGFMAFDAWAHQDAKRLFRFALACAEEADDWSLRASALCSLARQAFWLGDPDSSLTLIELAGVRADRLTPTERAMLAGVRSRALAIMGRVQDTFRSVGMADEEFSHSNPADDPEYVQYYDAGEHSGETGHALAGLVQHGTAGSDAVARLTNAITQHGNVYPRSRTFCQITLASVLMIAGDPTEAADVGARALDGVDTIRSHRIAENLRDLLQASKAHGRVSEVSELQDRIGLALAALPRG